MHSPIIQAAVAEAQRIILQRDEGVSIDAAPSRSTAQQERRQREALIAGFQGISEQVKRKPGQRIDIAVVRIAVDLSMQRLIEGRGELSIATVTREVAADLKIHHGKVKEVVELAIETNDEGGDVNECLEEFCDENSEMDEGGKTPKSEINLSEDSAILF